MNPVGLSRLKLMVGSTLCAAVVVAAIACENNTVTGPGFVCDVTNPVTDITFEPRSSSVLIHSPARSADTAIVIAHALNRVGGIRTDVPLAFSSSDTTVATVDTLGVVHARKTGAVKISASSCGQKASIDLTLVLLATSVEVKFDTVAIVAGDSVIVRARAHPQSSAASIPESRFTFSGTLPTGVTLTQRSDSTAVVKTIATSGGNIVVAANGEGVSGSASLVIIPRVVDVKFDSTAVVAGDSILVRARTHGQGVAKTIPGVVFSFAANPATGITFVQRSDSTAILRTAGTLAGAITVTATGDAVAGSAPITIIGRVVEAKLDTATVVAGDSVFVSARAHPQDNAASIPGAAFTFAASPVAGVSVVQRSPSTAVVKTSASGTFVITATNLGVNGSTTLTVLPRIFVPDLAGSQTSLDMGRDFGCGLIPLGRLYCWGLNSVSQLGGAPPDSTCFEEASVISAACKLNPVRVNPQLIFSSVSAGDGFACGIVSTGKGYCWGDGLDGKIGNGSGSGSATPVIVTSSLSFASISVGGNHACGITTTGSAFCWGQDSAGQLGDARRVNSTTPIPVVTGGAIAQFNSISAGFRHTCALDASGGAACWGLNDNGQLGSGGLGGSSDSPVAVAGGIAFKAISAGGDTVLVPFPIPHYESHTCAIATSGAAYCWGSNASGQLGIGSVDGSNVVVPTPVVGGLNFAKISAGARFTCGLTTAGTIYCWGRNNDLQLGRGPFTNTASDDGTPQLVTGGELPAGVTFVSVSAGKRHACGVASDGNAYCWGSNVFGALGNTLQAAFRGFPQRVATPQ